MKETKLYKGYIRLIETLKPMTGKQRVEHIWEYYKEYMFVALMVIVMLFIVFSSVFKKENEILLAGALVNVRVSDEGWKYINEDYFAHIGGVDGKQELSISSSFVENLYTSASNFDTNYNIIMSIVSMVNAKSLDYLLLDQDSMELYLTQDVMLELTELFTEEEIKALGDKVIYLECEDEDGNIVSRMPVAVNIADTRFAQDCMNIEKGCYFAVAVNAPHLDTCRNFWEYLMAWGS